LFSQEDNNFFVVSLVVLKLFTLRRLW